MLRSQWPPNESPVFAPAARRGTQPQRGVLPHAQKRRQDHHRRAGRARRARQAGRGRRAWRGGRGRRGTRGDRGRRGTRGDRGRRGDRVWWGGRGGRGGRGAGQLARGQLLVTDRRPPDVAQLRRRHGQRGTPRAARPRHDDDPVVLLLAGLHAGAGPDRRGHGGPVRRLPRPARRGRPGHGADLHRRAHVRRELGSGLAGRPRSVLRRVAGRPAGLVRRRDGAPVRPASGGVRLAGQQRDADLRRQGRAARGRRLLGADHPGRGARGRRRPAVLARRRGLGHRGQRRGERLPPDRHRIPVRLPRPALLPDERRPDPAELRGRLEVRAGRDVRPARRPGRVRPQLRSRLGRQRRALLPPGAPQQPAGRRDRLDRVEQHRLRPGRPGPLPAPRVRAQLRPDRRGRHAEAASSPR